VVLVDITERRRMEDTSLSHVAARVCSRHSLAELLQKTLDMIGTLTDSPIGFYHFVEPDQDTLSLAAWSTRTGKEFCTAKGRAATTRLTRLVSGWIAYTSASRHPQRLCFAPASQGAARGTCPITRELVVPSCVRISSWPSPGWQQPSDYNDSDVQIVSHLADVAWTIAEHKRAGRPCAERARFRTFPVDGRRLRAL